jgi:DNA-3-methyladenine glycosylase
MEAICIIARRYARCGVDLMEYFRQLQRSLMRLPLAFYNRPALVVARELLGKTLVHQDNGLRRAGRIVEAEAYVSDRDLACHASKGLTPRTEVLFGPPGRAYVYFIYGMYYCFNVVTQPEGVAAAVLVRAIEPTDGIPPGLKTDGPGKLCRALGITLSQNCEDLLGDRVYLEESPTLPPSRIRRGPRIGVDYAGPWAGKPYRFWVRGNPFVSAPRHTT